MTTYPKNFITKVIARVDFQPILKLKSEMPVTFQETIRMEFPRFDQQESINIALKPNEAPVAVKTPSWQFKNKEKSATIELNYQFIALLLDKYQKFDSFYPIIELMYYNFNKIYEPGLINRIGLRFVNEIKLKGDPFDWDGYINTNLFSMINAFPSLNKSLTRSMSQMHINLGDRTLVFNFGIFNSEYPNIITQKEFILDFDCFCQEETEPDLVLSKFKIFYEDIKGIFKQSRGEKLLKIMRGENL